MGLNIAGIWYKDRLGSLHLFPSHQCLTSMPRPKQEVYKVCTSKGKRKKKKKKKSLVIEYPVYYQMALTPHKKLPNVGE